MGISEWFCVTSRGWAGSLTRGLLLPVVCGPSLWFKCHVSSVSRRSVVFGRMGSGLADQQQNVHTLSNILTSKGMHALSATLSSFSLHH